MSWVRAAWEWSLGVLAEWPRPERDEVLLMGTGAVVSLALLMGMRFDILGAPLLRSAYRAGLHGGVPMAGALLWWLWRQRCRDPLAVGLVLLGGALVAFPAGARLVEGAIHALKPHSYEVFAAVVAGFGLLYAGAWRGGMRLDAFGLGLGDWRWWLPRTAIAAGIISAGVTAAMLTLPDLTAYYPSSRLARSGLAGLVESQVATLIGLFGWEMLFRGVLLWALARRGDVKLAIEANALVFFLAHIEKPVSEMLLSLPGGVIACLFAWRARSFVPVWLLHSLQLIGVNVVGFWLLR